MYSITCNKQALLGLHWAWLLIIGLENWALSAHNWNLVWIHVAWAGPNVLSHGHLYTVICVLFFFFGQIISWYNLMKTDATTKWTFSTPLCSVLRLGVTTDWVGIGSKISSWFQPRSSIQPSTRRLCWGLFGRSQWNLAVGWSTKNVPSSQKCQFEPNLQRNG